MDHAAAAVEQDDNARSIEPKQDPNDHEAIAIRLEAIAIRFEAIAIMLEGK